ncbi:centromere protein P [Esox lucius]|uniref:Centromere protein P n=1 Tax=Esox lucius TaxID=8010 RepID=A0AAY5KC70_ESOLU|nr:centromere protein P [Esox lucius]
MNNHLGVYETHIKVLQEEIAALQCQKEKNDRELTIHIGGSMKDALLSMAGRETGAKTGNSLRDIRAHLTAEIKELEEDLVRQTKMNGIVLTNCSVKTLEKNSRKMVQQYRLAGHCSLLGFQVEIEVTDVQEDAAVVTTITVLNIIMDTTECKEFGKFVSGVEENRDLLLFFRTLRRFSDRCDDRHRTFQHFQKLYPGVVSLPGGCRSEIMLIQSPKLPGCSLTLSWTIEVSSGGEVTPRLDLVSKMPEQALQFDSRMAIENAPDAFQCLLRVLGVEASIQALIQSVSV